MSGFGPKATRLAARIADGYITTSPDQDLVDLFRREGGEGKPTQAGFKVCYAETADDGVAIAHRLWANSGVPGELSQVLPSPRHFEQASTLVTPEMTAESVTCGPDPADHVEAFQPYLEVGFDEIYVANMGPHYAEMLKMYGEQVLPSVRGG
jgi:G6PDH family F420-dependent oxidoreductase